MKFFVSNKNESVRLFQNAFLEHFSHIHPVTPLVVFLPVILYFGVSGFFTAPPFTATVLMFVGLLFWTLLEYAMHRFAFHYEPKSNLGKRVHFLVHGVHHDYPRDATRLVMPLLVSLPLAFLFYLGFKSLFFPYHRSLYAGLVLGYLAYDCLHYAFHHLSFPGKIWAFLKLYHLKHHYTDPSTGYGVSNPLWDFVFGTRPKEATENQMKDLLDIRAA